MLQLESPEQFEKFRTVLLGRFHTLQQLWDLPGSVEANDVVQIAFTRAWEERRTFQGQSPGELCAWLLTILDHVTVDAVRRITAQKRDFYRVRSLEDFLADSTNRFEGFLEASLTSPSAVAQKNELAHLAYAAIELLPGDQRMAIVWRYLAGLSITELTDKLNAGRPQAEHRTEKAVTRLIERGLSKLRDLLKGHME
jgi:RNA polymerase sigma-70 factor (ECF subfamily)